MASEGEPEEPSSRPTDVRAEFEDASERVAAFFDDVLASELEENVKLDAALDILENNLEHNAGIPIDALNAFVEQGLLGHLISVDWEEEGILSAGLKRAIINLRDDLERSIEQSGTTRSVRVRKAYQRNAQNTLHDLMKLIRKARNTEIQENASRKAPKAKDKGIPPPPDDDPPTLGEEDEKSPKTMMSSSALEQVRRAATLEDLETAGEMGLELGTPTKRPRGSPRKTPEDLRREGVQRAMNMLRSADHLARPPRPPLRLSPEFRSKRQARSDANRGLRFKPEPGSVARNRWSRMVSNDRGPARTPPRASRRPGARRIIRMGRTPHPKEVVLTGVQSGLRAAQEQHRMQTAMQQDRRRAAQEQHQRREELRRREADSLIDDLVRDVQVGVTVEEQIKPVFQVKSFLKTLAQNQQYQAHSFRSGMLRQRKHQEAQSAAGSAVREMLRRVERLAEERAQAGAATVVYSESEHSDSDSGSVKRERSLHAMDDIDYHPSFAPAYPTSFGTRGEFDKGQEERDEGEMPALDWAHAFRAPSNPEWALNLAPPPPRDRDYWDRQSEDGTERSISGTPGRSRSVSPKREGEEKIDESANNGYAFSRGHPRVPRSATWRRTGAMPFSTPPPGASHPPIHLPHLPIQYTPNTSRHLQPPLHQYRAAVRYGQGARVPIPYIAQERGRRVINVGEEGRGAHLRRFRIFEKDARPLDNHHPSSKKRLGDYVHVNTQRKRSHVEVKRGCPRSTIRRLARIIQAQGKLQRGSILNGHIHGKEFSHGPIRDLTLKQIILILSRAARVGGFFVILGEEAGGALASGFWTHHLLAPLLSR